MRLAFAAPLPRGTARPPLRQRAVSLVLAAGTTLLMVLALWSLNVHPPERPRFKGSVLLDFKPDADTTDTTPKKVPTEKQPHQEETRPATPPPKAVLPPPPPPPPLPVVHPYYIPLTQEENDAADISKIRHFDLAGAGPRAAAPQGSAPGDSHPIGTAPDGTPLYAAQWFRRPTHAELSFYLPPHMPTDGWGLIACKTVAEHHVDDCVELGSSPPGSHLAGAVRKAAWQFLVRPPRLGGKELVGAWVSIRIDYSEKATDGEDVDTP